jgi:hypothetical protein
LAAHKTAAFIFMKLPESARVAASLGGRFGPNAPIPLSETGIYCARASPPSATIQLAKLPTKKYSAPKPSASLRSPDASQLGAGQYEQVQSVARRALGHR